MIIHARIKVTGKVQGVFFRKYTKEEADRLAITGIVRNEKDGSVYIEAEGTEEKINTFIKWCHRGSPSSEVSQVKVEYDAPKGFTRFVIDRD